MKCAAHPRRGPRNSVSKFRVGSRTEEKNVGGGFEISIRRGARARRPAHFTNDSAIASPSALLPLIRKQTRKSERREEEERQERER